jgi:hypothetical protein
VTCTDHGLLLSAPMVRAFLRGDKLSTMRPITARNSTCFMRAAQLAQALADNPADIHRLFDQEALEPRILPGHTVWFRETWAQVPESEDPRGPWDLYRATDSTAEVRWTPSIHMPRRAARCRARVVSVTPRRPIDLTPAELRSEGFPLVNDRDYPGRVMFFDDFWGALHPGKPKDVWCWLYGFEPLQRGA